jgi:hypothetical protein
MSLFLQLPMRGLLLIQSPDKSAYVISREIIASPMYKSTVQQGYDAIGRTFALKLVNYALFFKYLYIKGYF